ncbi:MAG: transporter substrate-binding domain-containing protein [Moraxella sp.]|uniref:substrate-binding periplasmic protein n=1 Tax=Moraxella sp. TaxID=479 RepID=UPI0026DD4C93|nr:transporter substrate-binding domain-containing protein [Moraxella sp.]MDO4450255.1 transporter substrate-binding domain-containing protein [Moraxella sp.]
MKKPLSILGLSLLLGACGSEDKPAQATTAPSETPSTQNTGKTYLVVTENESAPFIVRDEKGRVSGFEHDLLQAIAQKKGFNLDFISKTWDGMFASLESGEADIITSNISVTPERQQKYNFVTPHFQSATYALHTTNTAITNWKDLANKQVAVQFDTLQQELAGKYNINHTTYDTPYLALKAVFTGEQDVFIGDKGVIMHFHGKYPDSKIDALPDEGEPDMIAMAVKKDDTALLDILNDGMKQIRADGTYDQIYTKWFGNDVAATNNEISDATEAK